MQWDDVLDEIAGLPFPPETLLEIDLARLAEAGPPILGFGVGVLRRNTGARTLRDVTGDPDVGYMLQQAIPRNDRRAFLRAFLEAVRRTAREDVADGGAEEPAVKQPAQVARGGFDLASPPSGGKALERWAEHFGVAGVMGEWLRAPSGGKRGPKPFSAPLRVWLDLDAFPDTGRAHGWDRAAVRRAAVAEIVERARALAPLTEARAKYLARRREPEDAWLAERVRVLREQLEYEVPGDEHIAKTSPARLYPCAQVAFQRKPPSFVVRFPHGHVQPVVDLETGQICSSWSDMVASPRTLEERLAVGCAIDALCDPESDVAAQVTAWRATPVWQHALVAFEDALAHGAVRALDGPVDADERIAFRVGDGADGGSAEAPTLLVQKPKKSGGYTAGRQVDPYHAVRIPGMTLLEREIVELTMLLERSVYNTDVCRRVRVRVLELLADHPRVYAGADKSPVRVRRTRPKLRVTRAGAETEDAFRIELVVGDTALSPEDALDRVEHGLVCMHEPGAGSFLFASVDPTTMALLGALAAHPVALPNDALDAFLARLSAQPDLEVDLDLPEDARGKPAPADPRPVVRLALTEQTLSVGVRVKPLERGGAFLPGSAPKHVYASQADGTRVFATRDLDDEESRAEKLLSVLPVAGAVRRGAFDFLIDDADRACDIVATLRELGDGADGVVVEWEEGERLRVAGSAGPGSLRVKIDRRKDWFGLSGGIEIDGTKVPLAALLDAVRAGRRFVRLEGGRLVSIERELRKRLARVDDVVQRARDGSLAVHAPAVETIAALVEDESAQIEAAREWIELRERIRRAKASEPEAPSGDGVRAELRSYQLEGYKWLMRLAACGTGACLADDMGLGKTLQSLAVLHARKDLGPALVVAPTSVCANWIAEAARFTPELEVIEYRGAGRTERLELIGPGHVLVTSYDILVRDAGELAGVELATAIFDEAQAIKNALSKRAAAARGVRAEFRIALTGTPVENHTGDLWSIFRTVVPGLFGPWEDFRQRFAAPIERDRDPARSEALAAMVRPYLLRRTKREVSPELPPRTEMVRLVEPTPEERGIYERERAAIVEALSKGPQGKDNGDDKRFAILAALTRLRQLACHPRLRDPDAPATSAKLEAVLAMVDELREAGHKALVFSQFTSHLALVGEALRARGVTFFELDGSTPAEARADRVKRFQAGEADLFLISLKAGGVGLNLTAADYVLHLDPWWNPAAEDQASDRAHRIGQDKPVTIVRFVTQGTIEETVLELHADKRELADAILSGGDVAARLSTRELFALIEKGASLGA